MLEDQSILSFICSFTLNIILILFWIPSSSATLPKILSIFNKIIFYNILTYKVDNLLISESDTSYSHGFFIQYIDQNFTQFIESLGIVSPQFVGRYSLRNISILTSLSVIIFFFFLTLMGYLLKRISILIILKIKDRTPKRKIIKKAPILAKNDKSHYSLTTSFSSLFLDSNKSNSHGTYPSQNKNNNQLERNSLKKMNLFFNFKEIGQEIIAYLLITSISILKLHFIFNKTSLLEMIISSIVILFCCSFVTLTLISFWIAGSSSLKSNLKNEKDDIVVDPPKFTPVNRKVIEKKILEGLRQKQEGMWPRNYYTKDLIPIKEKVNEEEGIGPKKSNDAFVKKQPIPLSDE